MRIILIGDDKLTYFLSKKFVEEKHRVTIINARPVAAREFSHQIKATVIVGDGTHPTILREAEAEKADLVLALTSHDEDNLVACQIAQQQYSVPPSKNRDKTGQAWTNRPSICLFFSTKILIKGDLSPSTSRLQPLLAESLSSFVEFYWSPYYSSGK